MSKLFINDTSLTAIGDAIREKTGKEDLLTLEQMPQEIRGIESGGGSGLAYDMGEFVLDADTTGSIWIPHSLGDVPEFVCIWTDDFADLSADNPLPYTSATMTGYIWLDGLGGLLQRLTSTMNNQYGIYLTSFISKDSYVVTYATPTSYSYCLDERTLPTANSFYLAYYSNTYRWRAGVTYKYFVSKGWWDKK